MYYYEIDHFNKLTAQSFIFLVILENLLLIGPKSFILQEQLQMNKHYLT